MHVLLNEEELDIQFEKEEFLSEALLGIASWLESDAQYLAQFYIDGVCHSLPPRTEWDFSLFGQALQSIGKLELFSSPHDLSHALVQTADQGSDNTLQNLDTTVLESLVTLRDYFSMAGKAFQEKKFLFLQDLFSDATPLLELLGRSTSQAAHCLAQEKDLHIDHSENPLIAELKAALELWKYFQDQLTNEGASQGGGKPERMLAVLQDVSLLLSELCEDYQDQLAVQEITTVHPSSEVPLPETPQTAMTVIKTQLQHKGKELEEAVGNLQNGEVQQSLYCVSDLSLLLEKLLQHRKVSENMGLAKLFQTIRPFLQDLTDAIETTDIITIGDLIEYEIIPLIQQIVAKLDSESETGYL